MTDIEYVKARYPSAWCKKWPQDDDVTSFDMFVTELSRFKIYDGSTARIALSASFENQADAWSDAARRMREKQ
jgi:hypothetical protein